MKAWEQFTFWRTNRTIWLCEPSLPLAACLNSQLEAFSCLYFAGKLHDYATARLKAPKWVSLVQWFSDSLFKKLLPSILSESAQSREEGNFCLCPVKECGWAVYCIAVIVWMDTCQPRFKKLERSGWMPLPVQHQKSDRWLWLAVVPWVIPTINPALWCVPYSIIILVLHYIRMNHLSLLETQMCF